MSIERLAKLLVVVGALLALTAVPGFGAFAATDDRDAAITSSVLDRLSKEPGIMKQALEVATLKGRVILSGYVDTARTADKTIEIVKEVDGVRSIQNNLVVWEDGYPGQLPQSRGFQSP